MQIQVNKMTRSAYGTVHMELACNKTAAYVGIGKDGSIQVCTYNAAHRAWKGGGKHFRSLAAALENYRSAEMKAIIGAAHEAASLDGQTAH